MALAVTVGIAGALVDRDARSREARDVAGCVTAATDAVSTVVGRLTVVVRYVGPALAGSASGPLRESLLDMISAAAAPSAGPLRRARDRCAATDVLPFHTGLRRTRDDCLLLLEQETAYLRAVARDGTRVYGANDVQRGQCLPARD